MASYICRGRLAGGEIEPGVMHSIPWLTFNESDALLKRQTPPEVPDESESEPETGPLPPIHGEERDAA